MKHSFRNRSLEIHNFCFDSFWQLFPANTDEASKKTENESVFTLRQIALQRLSKWPMMREFSQFWKYERNFEIKKYQTFIYSRSRNLDFIANDHKLREGLKEEGVWFDEIDKSFSKGAGNLATQYEWLCDVI